MYELKIISHLSAAHQLREAGGQCERLHGHNWKIEVCVTGRTLDANGLLVDFRRIKGATEEVLQEMDHRFLNELDPFAHLNPSSENIARYIYESLVTRLNSEQVRVSKVTAWESDTACATYMEPCDRERAAGW
jgi:6-pyruvoyltetrahydropterin/6-carboxytetrahydropterin synthase